jgi:hypothetical protein
MTSQTNSPDKATKTVPFTLPVLSKVLVPDGNETIRISDQGHKGSVAGFFLAMSAYWTLLPVIGFDPGTTDIGRFGEPRPESTRHGNASGL